MKKSNIEIRSTSYRFDEVEEGSRTIKGLAIPVNSQSELLSGKNYRFYETISPNAVSDELIKSQDVKIYLDHDSSQGTFARSKYGEGSLKLTATERGLEFEFEAPRTAFGDMLLEGIRRGDYDKCSYAFISDPKTETVTRNEDGTYNRTINNIMWLDEISILSLTPAYDSTEVDVRSISTLQEQRNNEILSNLDKIYEDIEKNSNI